MLDLNTEAQRLLGITLSPQQIDAISTYTNTLQEWNSKFNLTAIREPDQILIKHFLDSLTCWLAIRSTSITKMIDVGTGAGFPGLVLKILLPEIHLTLVESVQKKANFCEHVIKQLGLINTTVLSERAEVIGQDRNHREKYDWAVARAVAGLPTLSEYLLPLVRTNGHMLAQKGETTYTEIESAQTAIKVLGGKLHQVTPVNLPGLPETRYLIDIVKIKPTPLSYPRHTGIPSKRPL